MKTENILTDQEIILYADKIVGFIAYLTLKSIGYEVKVVVDDTKSEFSNSIRSFKGKVYDFNYLENIRKFNILLCVHGTKILPKHILNKGHCYNVHPSLYKYKGAYPIEKMLRDDNNKASVAFLKMEEKVDAGKVLVERFRRVKGQCPIHVYNELYSLYAQVILEGMSLIDEFNPVILGYIPHE